MAPATDQVNLIIAVDEAKDRLSEVAERLRALGMKIEGELEALGTITGTIEKNKVELVSKVKGVSHVETSRDYQLAPPDADVQ